MTLGWTCWTGTWLCQCRISLGHWATHPHTGCFHPSGIQSGIWEAWRWWGSLELTAGVQLLGKNLSRGSSRGWSRALGTRGSFGGCTNTRHFGWHTSYLLGRPPGWSGTHQHLQGHRKDTGVSSPSATWCKLKQSSVLTEPGRTPTMIYQHLLPNMWAVPGSSPSGTTQILAELNQIDRSSNTPFTKSGL